MKVKENFVLRQVAQAWVVMPLGQEMIDLAGMLMLNDSGVLLWRCLEQGCELQALTDALVMEFGISPEQAAEDAREFVEKLSQYDCIQW